MAKLNPWQKIMRAAERGTGLRLSADDVWRLSHDDAIAQAATQYRATENRCPDCFKPFINCDCQKEVK